MKKTILLIALLNTVPAFADNCDKPRDDFDGLYCLNKVYIESDKELNVAYKELRAYLNKEEKSKLIFFLAWLTMILSGHSDGLVMAIYQWLTFGALIITPIKS